MNLLNLPLVPTTDTQGILTYQQRRAAEVGVDINAASSNALGLLVEGSAALVEVLHAQREREVSEGKQFGMVR